MTPWRYVWDRMPVCAGAGAGAVGRQARETLVPAMTRYSRSVIPGRPQEGEGDASLERAVFGAKKRPIAPPANDREDYSDPLDMELDEAGHLVDRPERRKADDRRKPNAERRKASDRRSPDFPPLRENGVNYRTADDGKRGPILLIGALVIVAVFGVVVWSAYRDGVKGDDPEAAAPQLASAGAFKTPPLEVKDAPLASGLPIRQPRPAGWRTLAGRRDAARACHCSPTRGCRPSACAHQGDSDTACAAAFQGDRNPACARALQGDGARRLRR